MCEHQGAHVGQKKAYPQDCPVNRKSNGSSDKCERRHGVERNPPGLAALKHHKRCSKNADQTEIWTKLRRDDGQR